MYRRDGLFLLPAVYRKDVLVGRGKFFFENFYLTWEASAKLPSLASMSLASMSLASEVHHAVRQPPQTGKLSSEIFLSQRGSLAMWFVYPN